MSKLTVSPIPNLNTIVIKQTEGKDFFLLTGNSIVITISALSFLISFLVKNNYISYKILEGILEEYHSSKGVGFGG